ncbi:DUF4397 domain-containing protein [Paenibacillus tarimensis]
MEERYKISVPKPPTGLPTDHFCGYPPIRMKLSVARFRLLHASPDLPAFDIYAGGKRAAADFEYKDVIPYRHVPSGQYIFEVFPAGNKKKLLLFQTLNIQEGHSYTIAASGSAGGLRLFAFIDDPAPAAAKARFKFIHLSPDTPAVDITSMEGAWVHSQISFGQVTDYLTQDSNSRALSIRPAGRTDTLLILPDVAVPDSVSTVVVVGCMKERPGLEALLLSDL